MVVVSAIKIIIKRAKGLGSSLEKRRTEEGGVGKKGRAFSEVIAVPRSVRKSQTQLFCLFWELFLDFQSAIKIKRFFWLKFSCLTLNFIETFYVFWKVCFANSLASEDKWRYNIFSIFIERRPASVYFGGSKKADRIFPSFECRTPIECWKVRKTLYKSQASPKLCHIEFMFLNCSWPSAQVKNLHCKEMAFIKMLFVFPSEPWLTREVTRQLSASVTQFR